MVLVPHYFLENQIATDDPPAITHPEFFYGFVGRRHCVANCVFDHCTPIRCDFGPMMLPSVFEKFSFGIAAIVLFVQKRLPEMMLGRGHCRFGLGRAVYHCVAAVGCEIHAAIDERAAIFFSPATRRCAMPRAAVDVFNAAWPVEMPAFMPVGTQGTVKGLEAEMLRATGAQMILANTYHLALAAGRSESSKSWAGCTDSWAGMGRF